MTEYMKAWQCIGCGKIDGPQTCVGICQDRKVQLVYASEYEGVVAELGGARRRLASLEILVRKLAITNPRKNGWETSYRAMQEQARVLLA